MSPETNAPEIERMDTQEIAMMLKVTLPKMLAGIFGPASGDDAIAYYQLDGIALRGTSGDPELVLRYKRESRAQAPFPSLLYMDGENITQHRPVDIPRYKTVKDSALRPAERRSAS